MRVFKHWDGSDPGGTPGRPFTASIGQEYLVQGGNYLDHLKMGLKGAVSTAAVAIEDFIDVLAEYDFWVGSELRLKLDGNDLCALMAAYYREIPYLGENTDGTGNDFVGGIKIPIQQAFDAARPFAHAATRQPVANISSETISVTGYWLDADPGRKPVHAVVVTLTSSGATGDDQYTFILPKVGKLMHLIAAMPAASDFADGNIDVSFQRVKLMRETTPVAEFNTLGDSRSVVETNVVSQSIFADLLGRYKIFDLGPEGLDLKESNYTIKIDNEDPSDALRFIPVVEIQ
jgi:hypothetical protein